MIASSPKLARGFQSPGWRPKSPGPRFQEQRQRFQSPGRPRPQSPGPYSRRDDFPRPRTPSAGLADSRREGFQGRRFQSHSPSCERPPKRDDWQPVPSSHISHMNSHSDRLLLLHLHLVAHRSVVGIVDSTFSSPTNTAESPSTDPSQRTCAAMNPSTHLQSPSTLLPSLSPALSLLSRTTQSLNSWTA